MNLKITTTFGYYSCLRVFTDRYMIKCSHLDSQ